MPKHRKLSLQTSTLLLTLLIASSPAYAHSSHAGDIAIGHAWSQGKVSKNLLDSSTSLEVHLPLLNGGAAANALVGVESPLSEDTALETLDAHNKMTAVGSIPLMPNKPVAATLLLTGLKQPIKTRDHIPLVLHFQTGAMGHIDAVIEEKPSSDGDKPLPQDKAAKDNKTPAPDSVVKESKVPTPDKAEAEEPTKTLDTKATSSEPPKAGVVASPAVIAPAKPTDAVSKFKSWFGN